MNSTDDDEHQVTHGELLEKLVEHEGALARLHKSIDSINDKLDPIIKGIGSIAFAFKGLLIVGAGSAAVAGILELVDRLTK